MKGSPLLSPKMPKTDVKQEQSRLFLMKKRSPTKVFDEKDMPGINNSVNYNQKNEYAKNDRNNRLQLLIKNHAKCVTLNQMMLDMFRLEQQKSVYVAYFIFKNIEKELGALSESLRKETSETTQDVFKQFKNVVDKQL